MNLSPHPFTLRQLQYVLAVAHSLSFRKAAEACGVSQPSLSAQLGQVESSLGVRIFERDRKRVIVTVAGADVIEAARRLLLGADDLLAVGRRTRDPLEGTLRIGVIPTVSPYLLPLATRHLRATFPRLTSAWVEEKTDTLLEKLARGAIEAAILATPSGDADLESARLAVDPFVLVCPPGHRLDTGEPVRLSELRGEEMMLLDDGHCFREQALEVCGTARVRESELRATSLSTLVQMVAGGAGITLLPRLSLETETRRADLGVRPFSGQGPHRTLALVWRKHSPYARALTAIADALRTVLSGPGSAPAPTERPARARKVVRPRSGLRST